jgi:GT2 family glycosyltransferase
LRVAVQDSLNGSARESLLPDGVTIVVPTYRRPAILRQTLHALLDLDFAAERLEVLVVDDGRDEESAAVVAALPSRGPRVEYLRPESRGAAGARNQGARRARHGILLFVDDDIILKRDSIDRYRRALQQFAPCAVNARWEFAPDLLEGLKATPFGRYRIEVEKWVKTGLARAPLEGRYQEIEGLTACNLAILRDDFWRLGGFDESFPHAGAEDQELSLRAKAEGLRLVMDDEHEVWHNDHRLTVRDFCERQRRGALSALCLAAKHPQTHAGRPLITENLPIRARDPWTVTGKKAMKRVLGYPPFEDAHFLLAALVERLAPDSRVLRRLYWSLFGVAIFKGVQEGVRELDPQTRAALETR